MKILTEKQQIDIAVKKAWDVMMCQDNKLDILKNQLQNLYERFFINKNKIRLKRFDVLEQEESVNCLRSYYYQLQKMQHEASKINP